MRKHLSIVLMAIVFFAFCSVAVLFLAVSNWLHTELEITLPNNQYELSKGASLHSVAQDLKSRGIIKWPTIWVQYAKYKGLVNIKAGEYILKESESPASILETFNLGKVVQYQITLVEGNRFKDFLKKIHAQDKIVHTLDYENAISALKAAGVEVDHLEGWFYPDTFQYSAGDTDISILVRAHEKMKAVLTDEWMKRDKDLPYKNAYEALIMASIVEKETGVAYERAQIAGVFVRRLEKKMRLQTDPTVIYGMGENYNGNITRKDLRTRTSYNTYMINGLPPTPIAMPGREAIHAALHPEPGKSLYFVARGDGTHYFSETIEQHNEAVYQYQKKRRKDYRSSPQLNDKKAVSNER